MLVTESCLTLCKPRNCRPPGSRVHGILQTRILEWVAIPFSRGSFWLRDWTRVSCMACRLFTNWANTEAPGTTRISYTHAPFLHLLPVQVTADHWEEILVLDSRFSIIAYFTHSVSSVSVSIPTSQSTPCPLPHWYTSVPYVWVSISALQMRSSTPVFPDSRLYMLIETKRDFFLLVCK